MPKTTILSVDDDKDLQTVVGHYLTSEGHKIIPAYNGEQARQLLVADNAPGLVLLDLGLPDTDGITLLGQIRASVKIPVIVVSGKSDTTEKIVCLEMGADDYMTKPFEMRELSARIKAVLRRGGYASQQSSEKSESKPLPRVRFGPWIMEPTQFQIFNEDGQSADLTAGEYKLLEAMVSAPNTVMTRERLFELTRENDYDSFDRAVDIQIGRLRKKLDDDPKEQRYIKTVRGVGYMFCGEADTL